MMFGLEDLNGSRFWNINIMIFIYFAICCFCIFLVDFQKIESGQSKKLPKKGNVAWITAIDATKRRIICVNDQMTEDYLYYDGDVINSLVGLNPKCREKHTLQSKHNKMKQQCNVCDEIEEKCFYCRHCKEWWCKLCLEDMIQNKMDMYNQINHNYNHHHNHNHHNSNINVNKIDLSNVYNNSNNFQSSLDDGKVKCSYKCLMASSDNRTNKHNDEKYT